MLTAAEIAAWLGVSAGRVRQVVAKHSIKANGKRGRMHTYRLDDITRHTGHSDRLANAADLH
jgi:hypothetical protein